MVIGIQDEILKINSQHLLDRLLMDKTTKSNIIWATDAYTELGAAYHRDKEITVDLITGQHSGVIKNRARKALEQQSERTRKHAEVFTPLWICEKMNDHIDEMWFGRKQGMSNFLFQNISNVFGAPAVVREIVEKLTPAHEDPKKKRDAIEDIDKVDVNADGEVEIPSERIIGTAAGLFGEKVYETAQADVDPLIATVSTSTDTDAVRQKMDDIISTVKETVKTTFVAPVVEQYDIKKSAQKRIESQVDTAIERDLTRVRDDYMQQAQIAQAELERKRQDAFGNQAEIKKAEDDYAAAMGDAMKALTETIQETVQKTITEKPKEVIEQVEKAKAEEEKKTVEDSVRDHLRGFSRTIPSFIMAYGDETA